MDPDCGRLPPVTTKRSAGVLLHRSGPDGEPLVLLGHMGGPFWARKDERAWSIPKGEPEPGEEPLVTARREFAEELGSPVPAEEFTPLGEFTQSGGKVVTVFAAHGDLDAEAVVSGTFSMVWPPRSGEVREFPEIDRAAWFDVPTARAKLVAGQVPALDALLAHLGAGRG